MQVTYGKIGQYYFRQYLDFILVLASVLLGTKTLSYDSEFSALKLVATRERNRKYGME